MCTKPLLFYEGFIDYSTSIRGFSAEYFQSYVIPSILEVSRV